MPEEPVRSGNALIDVASDLGLDLRSEIKAVVSLNDGRKMSIHRPLTAHLWLAENKNPIISAAILITILVKIDDRNMTLQEVLELPTTDFNSILKEITA